MSTKSKKTPKPPRGHVAATSAISQPVVEDASFLTALSSFSPSGNLFTYLSLAVDKHRLRIYDTTSGQSIAENVLDSARVSSLTWGNLNPADWAGTPSNDAGSPSKKKRKKGNNGVVDETKSGALLEVVVLGLSDGTVMFFSPKHGRTLQTLSHPTCTSAILAVASTVDSGDHQNIWTSGADGSLRLWNVPKNDLLGSWKSDDRIPYSSLALRPTDENAVDILAANHSIRILSADTNTSTFDSKPKQLASFTGHASSIRHLQWDASQTPINRFVSLAEADRVVSIWEVPQKPATEGKMVASVQLDSDARAFSLSKSSPSTSPAEKQTLLTLAASGKVSVFPIPSELLPPASSTRTQHKISTLLPRSTLAASSKKGTSGVQVVAASFVDGEEGRIRIARIVGGVRPVFDVLQYLDDSGDFIADVVIEDVKANFIDESHQAAPNKRYTEGSAAVGSGVQLGQDQEMDDLVEQNVEGELDVDIAELSLGQRLTALTGAEAPAPEDSDDDEPSSSKQSKKKTQNDTYVVPASSLTRTLIQALHSADSKLLETCLAHSDQTLIRNTVRRLPSQLAVPLITACVDRLGRGARAGNMKGGGGGASSQRGMGLITWVKTVLVVHSGHLMTMPELVARLSGLHATLTTRLALQDSLLSLSGRLDMVLSQIEMRSSVAPAPIAPSGTKSSANKSKEIKRYVEGESEDEDEQMDVEVEVDDGDDDAGSVEDVELGGDSSQEESEEAGESGDDDEEEDDDSEGPTMNGFIDDEADEYTDEDEDESE